MTGQEQRPARGPGVLPRAALGLYPPAWRARYGDEVQALLEDSGAGVRAAASLAWHALPAWAWPARHLHDRPGRMRASLASAGTAWALLAGMAAVFVQLAQAQGSVQDPTLARHPVIQWSYWAFDGAVIISLLAVAAGGLPLWLRMLRDARATRRPREAAWLLTPVVVPAVYLAASAVTAVTGEYATGMIRTTLAAVPGRTVMLTAKAVVVTTLAMAAGSVAAGGSLLAGRLILPGQGYNPAHGYPGLSLLDPVVLRAAAGTVLYLALIALLSLGIATAVRDAAIAIGTVLGLLYLFPVLGLAVSSPGWHRHLQQIAPMTAGLEIQASTGLSTLPISPWAGLGVLATWAVAALAAGGFLLRLRDA